MLLLDLTLRTAAENLALDEALLEAVDDEPAAAELLRLWECPQTAVVLGRSCKAADEVDLAACREDGVPVLRRTSGGGTVLVGPGCLMFSLRLSYLQRPHLRLLDEAHREVLTTVASAVNSVLNQQRVEPRGTSDLAIGETKVSGNSLRCKRHFLLYHGTLLYDFNLSLVQRLLLPPPRQPAYRHAREHRAFITNLAADPLALRQALIHSWQADQPTSDWPQQLTGELLEQRYGRDAWNLER
ncbi:biotin/lipoate A/B protein ligase family protein [Anatilimnocola sp. NA78]|uniref:lipoate--protein ligase family protein n=1 Tax=Anatilimnocola sp. NA78 TaxID=3415683 RepID=UPI003CE4EA4F